MAKIISVRFVAYSCPEAPEHLRWVGEILMQPAPTPKRPAPREQWWNSRFPARTKALAIASAEEAWKALQAKSAAEKATAARRAESQRKVAA